MGNPTSINRDYSIASAIESIDISEKEHLGRFFNLDLLEQKRTDDIYQELSSFFEKHKDVIKEMLKDFGGELKIPEISMEDTELTALINLFKNSIIKNIGDNKNLGILENFTEKMKLIVLIYVYLRLKGENVYKIVDKFIIPFNKIIFAGVEVPAVHRKKIEQQKVDRALSRKK